LAGPPIVKDATEEELGGVETHADFLILSWSSGVWRNNCADVQRSGRAPAPVADTVSQFLVSAGPEVEFGQRSV
jgi:hypothetical protein